MVVGNHHRLDPLAELFDQRFGARRIGVQVQREFLATTATQAAVLGTDCAQPNAELPQDLVASRMAVAIIDLFEVVHIGDHHGKGSRRTGRRTKRRCA